MMMMVMTIMMMMKQAAAAACLCPVGGFVFKFVSTCDGTCCNKKDRIMPKKGVESSK